MANVEAKAISAADRLLYAKILLEIGEAQAAEREVVEVLDSSPEDLTALNLYAKIKHIRGEISQAVACWAQIHARSAHNETALMQLSAMLHLAQDPERGADEFVALGQYQLARKPLSHLELEKAFRLFLSHQPAEARVLCERLAQRHRRSDRQMFKLATMAKAWIAELSGELDEACAALEALGRERGFETDTDRVLSLVRLYERIGTPQRLQAALNICRYIEEHFEKISMLSRLAVIYRKLGKTSLEKEYEQRYLEAFRRRSHRPSLQEVARVAAGRYLPLSRLLQLRLEPAARAPEPGPREQAVALALSGDPAAALQRFRAGTEELDRRYEADVTELLGRADEALALYLSCLRRDPTEHQILLHVLARHERERVAGLEELLQDPGVGPRALESLGAAIRGTPLKPALWYGLATLQRILGSDADAARSLARAQAMDEAAQRRQHPIGRVLAAAVYHFVGKAKGLVHEVWADRSPSAKGQGGFLLDEDILGNLTPDLKRSVRNVFMATREYARSKFPHLTGNALDYNYTFKVTKEDEPSGGLSAGLPSALAFLSVLLQRPVPQDTAYTGMIVADAHDVLVLRRVGEAEYKVKGAYNRNLKRLVLPLENRQDLVHSREVPAAIHEELVCYASSLDEVVSMTFGEDVWM